MEQDSTQPDTIKNEDELLQLKEKLDRAEASRISGEDAVSLDEAKKTLSVKYALKN